MRYLGIDYGKKRIGLAISDGSGTLAFPFAQLPAGNSQLATETIADVVKKNDVKAIIIGIPLTFGGKESAQAKEIRQFAGKLANKVELPIGFENEMLTTKIASRKGDSKHIDASSAAIILQSYLDKENRK